MKNQKTIVKITKELFEKMGFKKPVVKAKKQKNSPLLIIKVQVDDSNQTINKGDPNLENFQRILKILVSKEDLNALPFLLDVNNYREKRKEFLIELAKKMAEQAVENKRTIMLQPMSSYERRVIHLELSKNSNIITESIGEEPERRVVIKSLS